MPKTAKYFFVIAGVFILLPELIYLLNFGKDSISENPSDWGTFGDFFGGVLGSILSLCTLIVTIVIAYELKKSDDQRNKQAIETTYIPQLIIEEKSFYLYSLNPSTTSLKMEFSYDDKSMDDQVDQQLSKRFFGLQIYNIGLGTAKNINVDFRFDIINTVNLINHLAKNVPNSIEVVAKSKNGVTHFLEFSSTDYKSMNAVSNQTIKKINHILPINVSSNHTLLSLPSYLQELYSSFSYNYFHASNHSIDFIFPTISIYITYYDIGNKHFTKKFEVNFEMVAMQSDVKNKTKKFKSFNAIEVKEFID